MTITIRAALERARQAGACQSAINEIAEFARQLPEGEMSPVIDLRAHPSAPEWAYWYARHVIQDRWREAEPTIAADPEWAYRYARDVIGDRWPEAEPAIATGNEWAYFYAADVICGRWPEAEPIIAADQYWAYRYARDVIGDEEASLC